MRVSWDSVDKIISRIREDTAPNLNGRLDGLVEIGIDETSYRKGHKYIAVVMNHATNTVIWDHEGHGKAILTLLLFMES